MKTANLYQQIAEAIRQDILSGHYQPGDRLPSVRQLCAVWKCPPGTIQRAYNELASQGLLISRSGRGTLVAGSVPPAQIQGHETLRRANLVNRMEAVLLRLLTDGYTPGEVQQAMELALDHWRAVGVVPAATMVDTIRFIGSHDWVVNALSTSFFGPIVPGIKLQVTYTGSLGGLMALASGQAELAGCHLWDQESDTYNLPFIHRVLPGQSTAIVTLAHRRLGLIVAPGNPLGVHTLADLTRPGVKFVNRQSGSGTRVWLDAMLARQGIDAQQINGYGDKRLTHTDVARAIAAGDGNVGLALETAGQALGLDFIFLKRERYDLVMMAATAQLAPLRELLDWLASDAGKQLVTEIPGYENQDTGCLQFSCNQ